MASTGTMATWRRLGWLGLFVALMASGCGDDSGGAGSGPEPEPEGESCPQSGLTMVNCECDDGMFRGVRRCQENLTWSACDCPPVTDTGALVCREGQRVICNPCAGGEKWETVCDADGTFDCSCDSAPAAGVDAGARGNGN